MVATCGARNTALLKELGADTVLDYKAQQPANELEPGSLDLVIDCFTTGYSATRSLLKGTGRYCTLLQGADLTTLSAVARATISGKLPPRTWLPAAIPLRSHRPPHPFVRQARCTRSLGGGPGTTWWQCSPRPAGWRRSQSCSDRGGSSRSSTRHVALAACPCPLFISSSRLTLRPQVYPWHEVQEATRRVEEGHATGKVVLTIS